MRDYDSPEGPAKSERRGATHAASIVGERIDLLAQAVSVLESRLAPLLLPPEPSDRDMLARAEDPTSDLTGAIRSLGYRIETLTDHVTWMAQAVDL